MSAGPLARAFGAVLADARRGRGLSQEQLAEIAGFDRTYPSLLERGLREPGLSAFVRLSVALGHPPTALLAATLGLAAGSAAHGSSSEGTPLPQDAAGTASSSLENRRFPELLFTGPPPALPENAVAPRPVRQSPQPVRKRRRAHDGPNPTRVRPAP